MKRVLSMLLLLWQLSAPGVNAQTISFSLPDSLAGKNWVKNLIREELKKVGTTPVTPTDPGVSDPTLSPCKEGPFIKEISNVSSTYLNVRFHGDNVTKLNWKILDASGIAVRSGEISPENNTPGITYNTLASGKYTLILSGASCKSDLSHLPFTIAGSIGVITPPTDTKLAVIAKGMNEHMRLSWKKDGDGYLVSDVADTNQIGKDYEYAYMIGSEIIKTGKGALKNYRISGFNPGRIAKYKIKPGLTLANWTSDPKDVSWFFSLDAAEGFSYNTSVAFETFAFPGATGDFVNPIPTEYNPSLQNTQWGDFAPDMQLPKGHVFVSDPRPWGWKKMFQKGITHISNFALPWDEGQPYTELIKIRDSGKSYNDVPRIETILGITKSGNSGETWPNGVSKDWWPKLPTYEDGYQMGLKADISHALFIGEFSENISWLPPDSPAFKGFYDAYMPRMEAQYGKKGIPYLVCHDYLKLGGEKLSNGREQAKRLLTLSPDQMPVSNYSPGGTLAKTNLIVETVYLDAIDKHVAQPYELIFKLNLYEQMGYTPGVFLAGVHEWRPNNAYQINYPEGLMFVHNKVPLDPNLHVNNGFISQVFGKLFIEWGGNGKVNKKTIPTDWQTSMMWFPTGSTSPQGGFQHYKTSGDADSYYGYSGSVDLSYFSQKLFNDTYGKVDGGKDQYLSYRLDSGKWITPAKHDYIDAFFDKRAFVHSRTLSGKTAFFYLNNFTDNASHKLEVRLPDGSIWTGTVAGSGVHAKLL